MTKRQKEMIFLLSNEVYNNDVKEKYRNNTSTTGTTSSQNHRTKLSPPLLLRLEDKEERTKHKEALSYTVVMLRKYIHK